MMLVKATREELPGVRALLLGLGAGEHGFGGTDFGRGLMTLEAYLIHLEEMFAGTNLPSWMAPMTTFWLLDDGGRAVGMSRLRHRLTEDLLNKGGHIGYYIRRDVRGQGLGKQLLAATLCAARQLGIPRALLTADIDNAASTRVIEANGGQREDIRVDEHGTAYGRYWIEISECGETSA